MVNKLRLLSLKKEEAVREEDFDLAMGLKEVCDRLKILGHKLIQLESNKAQAIEGEDFLSAKAFKQEIEHIKYEIGHVDPLDPFGSQKVKTMTVD